MAMVISPSTFDLLEIAPLHQFSSADYLQMIKTGLLDKDDRVELIGGMILNMSPQGSRHNHFLMQLNRLFAPLWNRVIVGIQPTVTLAEGHVFDPDCVLLRDRKQVYKERHPGPPDILLVVEAAESSLSRDQKIKLPVYASSGIQEYWIADLDREDLIVHREPEGNSYRFVRTLRGDDMIAPLAAPELAFAVRQAFE
jgi:Uma2 family endonuclease